MFCEFVSLDGLFVLKVAVYDKNNALLELLQSNYMIYLFKCDPRAN